MEDEIIRTLVTRLARPHPSGGKVIERAAILSSGSESGQVLEWLLAHDAVPEEEIAPVSSGRGLHSSRISENAGAGHGEPRRYVLPPGALD